MTSTDNDLLTPNMTLLITLYINDKYGHRKNNLFAKKIFFDEKKIIN